VRARGVACQPAEPAPRATALVRERIEQVADQTDGGTERRILGTDERRARSRRP
jgi:hypothetical protein